MIDKKGTTLTVPNVIIHIKPKGIIWCPIYMYTWLSMSKSI